MPYRNPSEFRFFRVISDSSAAPERAAFRNVGADEIRAYIAESEDAEGDVALRWGSDSAAAASVAATLSEGVIALAAAEAGVETFHARDEDGDWFAVAGDSLLELPFEALSLGDQFAALDAARRLAAEDAAADRAAGVYPVTDARSEYIHDVIPPPNIETVSAYLAAYAAAGDWWE